MHRPSKLSTAFRLLLATLVCAATLAVTAGPAAAAVTPAGTNPTTPSNTAVTGSVTFTPTAAETIGWYDQSGPTANGTVTYDSVTGGGLPGVALTFTYTYTPNTNYIGGDSDEFRVQACGMTGCADVTHTETFTVTNQPPVIPDGGSYTVVQDTPIWFTGTVTDPDGGTTYLESYTTPANGFWSGNYIHSSGYDFYYQSNSGYVGTDSFTLTYADSQGGSTTATFNITVTGPPNNAPVAVADSYDFDEDASISGNVLDNDTDADGDTLTIASNTAPANASTFTLAADGAFAYIPNQDWSGTDTFTYTPTDGTDQGNTVTVTLTVAPVNDAPLAVDDTYSTPSGTELVVDAPGIFDNDTDADAGDTFQLVTVSGPTNGTFDANGSTGAFTYMPDPGFRGTDTFTYTSTDGNGGFSNEATVTITVDNAAPVAVADDYTLDEDATETGNVLDNDSDANDDTLTVINHTLPANADAFTMAADGTFTYTPAANWSGTDSFTYTPGDGTDAGGTVTVTFTVEAVNDAPVAVDAAATTDEDTAVSGTVAASDVDDSDLEFSILEPPASGALLLDPATGEYTFTPAEDFNGDVFFTVEVTDSSGASGTATITVTVTPVNDAPVASAGTVDSPHNTGTDIWLSDYVTDVDAGDTHTYSVVTAPINGTFTLVNAAEGAGSYEPDPGFAGADVFTYQVCDAAGACDTATVTVTVAAAPPAQNEAPVATGGQLVTDEDTPVAGDVTVTDADDTVFSFEVSARPANGTVTVDGDGSFTYTPAADFSGTDSFTIRVCDPDMACDTATFTVTVNPVDDTPQDAPVAKPSGPSAPVAVGDRVTLTGGGSTSFDGSTLTYAWAQVSGPAVTLDYPNGMAPTFVASEVGTYVFELTVCDTDDVCDTETVEVVVLAAGEAPVPGAPTAPTPAPQAPAPPAAPEAVASRDQLPETGSSPVAPISVGLALLALGAAMTATSRRRLGS